MFSRDGSPVEKTYPQRENQRLPVPRVGKFDPSSTATSLAVLLSRSSAITILDFLQGSFANVESATALEFVGRLVGDQFFSRIHKRHAYSTHTHQFFSPWSDLSVQKLGDQFHTPCIQEYKYLMSNYVKIDQLYREKSIFMTSNQYH
jgi:hypothetical protein